MDITRNQFDALLPEVTEAINSAIFVSFDLEFSGIPRFSNTKGSSSGRQTLEERYAETKEAAGKFQILQFGLCTVHLDPETEGYTFRPFNLTVNPCIPEKFGLEREFSVQAGAMKFLAENGFNLNSVFSSGVPYLTHAEEKVILEKELSYSTREIEDIEVDDASKIFVEGFIKALQDWVDDPDPFYDFLNITTPGGSINGYHRRLVHQVVRSKFPTLTSVGKGTFVQVTLADPAAEKNKREERRERFKQNLGDIIGLRHIIDAIFQSKKVLVGHNLFTDLIYLYACFYGPLPETAAQFAKIIHSDFPMVIDTKFLATFYGDTGNASSNLQILWETFMLQEYPQTDLHVLHSRYAHMGYSHEAGYDAYNAARILIKLIGRYSAYISQCTKTTAAKTATNDGDDDGGGGKKGLEEADKRLMEFIAAVGTSRDSMETDGGGGGGCRVPAFDDPFWARFRNRLRVFGTVEGEWVLGE